MVTITKHADGEVDEDSVAISEPISKIPSDRGRTDDLDTSLLDIAKKRGAIRYGDFRLSSGRKSSYYFDGRLLSLDPEGAYLLGKKLLPLLTEAGVSAIGGPTLGADPIVAAVATVSWEQGQPIPAFIVRKEAKEHGTSRLIEGWVTAGATVAIVDDTCTTGGSLLHAIAAAEDAGCTVALVLAILDRNEGGSADIRRRGYRFASLLTAGNDGQIRPA
jgi:orotate phosphoribosyltransferase